jgi:predicted amidophosphoribosyltransferase
VNWRELAEIASHLVAPRSCPLCGELGRFVCEDCLRDALSSPAPLPRCAACGGPSPCARHGTRYEVRALALHRDAARELLLSSKYGGAGGLARRLGRELARIAPDGGDWTITTIPEHPSFSFFLRVFHLEWMARGLAAETGWPVQPLLDWTRKFAPQKEQPDARSRRALPRDCFACVADVPEKVILLDDVSTTGTTLERAASCLYAGGAKEVLCLCFSVAERG